MYLHSMDFILVCLQKRLSMILTIVQECLYFYGMSILLSCYETDIALVALRIISTSLLYYHFVESCADLCYYYYTIIVLLNFIFIFFVCFLIRFILQVHNVLNFYNQVVINILIYMLISTTEIQW